MKNALIIFTKNLLHGKVKTRLAATIGHDKALEIYKKLIEHTYSITNQLPCDKIIYYSSYIDKDLWHECIKKIQNGNDLGERMANAFRDVFEKKYTKVMIIGTDCPQLNSQIINDAFEQLNNNDIIIGPAADGGYYLLAMKELNHKLFENIEWSAATVLENTISKCNQLHLNYCMLPILHDVDEAADLKYMNQYE